MSRGQFIKEEDKETQIHIFILNYIICLIFILTVLEKLYTTSEYK
jgi:hypothetical protein